MPKVLCTLENASQEISGVKFEQTEDGMLSEDVSDETAAYFCQINGYALKDDGAAAARDAAAAEADDLAALTARAAELGIEVKSTRKAARLTAEIKRAEEAKAAADAAGQ